MDLSKYIVSIPDFPTEGVLFRDITPLMQDPFAYHETIDALADWVHSLEQPIDVVVGPEARGFLFGCPVAYKLLSGFVPVRKAGKLPRPTVHQNYALEYGENTIYMHQDSIKPGQKVVIVDDLLATGGTVKATIDLVEKLGGIVVGIAFVIEIKALQGRTLMHGYPVHALLQY